MSIATVGEYLIHYEALGRGQPVIFLHGWVGSWRYWLSTMQALSHRFRTYAVDLVGFGDSAKPRQGADSVYRLERYVELVQEWMDHLGIPQAHFIGHTLGAMVAIRVALQHPDRVGRVLAVGYPVSLELPKGILGPAGKGILTERLSRLAQEYPEVQREHLRADPEAIGLSLEEALTRQDALREWLRLADRPLLLVYGRRDPLIPPPLFLNGSLDASIRLIILEEGRHFPMLDLPAPFQRLAEDFLTLPDPSQITLKEEWRRRFR
ncbi:alpha/beta fold hydrolase [Thermoflexus sp.]|uniref:alpha/beta fold hydrolase n=1 Tax=Thermoflexus sp. TaxID=1969742 RepID=UPI0025DF23BC|nr:alpha/beta hydrolase [Thermoflexus sp.]MDW8179850.1 alpha/beta hydrolase [Anaerolineae bacterium]MCS6963457.1 alpha/beta hydrolase [Thermoflexus sp.]MCS7350399.1 alpha/beta hydrolase [Thermoflexus sp.]MCX7689945.1 alpha/beta hydrolase [Thermoflexus sp.]MDW8184168.1 alpha/beta hydrolase [Anaerolineae bacterium]